MYWPKDSIAKILTKRMEGKTLKILDTHKVRFSGIMLNQDIVFFVFPATLLKVRRICVFRAGIIMAVGKV